MSSNTTSAFEAAKSLLRTTIRTFFPNPKQIVILDALLTYNVLHPDEFTRFFPANTTQPKEIRSLLNPLYSARLVAKGTRAEVRVQAGGIANARTQQREYCFVDWHAAVDAIKFKLVRLQDRVADMYKETDAKRRDWSCPRCKAEYDEMSILDKLDMESGGFFCEKCGTTLVQNEAAVKERGEHAKIMKINLQLQPFNELIGIIDRGEVPDQTFEMAWETRREPPAMEGQGGARFMDVKQRDQEVRKVQATVDAAAVETTIADEKERVKMEEEAKRIKIENDARRNLLPTWHTQSAIKDNAVKTEGGESPFLGLKKENEEDKKVLEGNAEERKMQEDLDAYMAELDRERIERERKEAEEDSDEEDEDDFEDIPGSSVMGTPASSQQPISVKQEIAATPVWTNGLKRELDEDGESVSGTSTGANTPAYAVPTSQPDPKKLKLENGHAAGSKAQIGNAGWAAKANGAAADSDEDEDFEDV